MASQSLYRKWRSQTFADLIGQEAVTRTLRNAVRDNRLAHAYLFCGPRGTGKTSAARLLAKAVNCAHPEGGEPCNECLSCREITGGHAPDVIEIDAASNTGVDNIRDLRENVNLLGVTGRYKVYIIDEAHMLSTQAFNALLKTLEEPPPHVIFVLATTESHKVPPTVVSRCQPFNFRRFRLTDIVARIEYIARQEGIELDPGAAVLLARAAQGGMRDAISLLDQAIAFCGTRIDLAQTRAMLGLADPGTVTALITSVADGDARLGLHLVNDLVESGADLRQLNTQLGEEWRALLLCRAGADVASLIDRSPDDIAEISTLAERFSLAELTACARVFARNEGPARGVPIPQLALELSLLDCIQIRSEQSGGSGATPSPRLEVATPAPTSQAVPSRSAPELSAPPVRSAARGWESAVELDLDAAEPVLPAPSLIAPDTGSETPVKAAPAPVPASSGDRLGETLQAAQAQWDLVKQVCKQRSRSVAALLHSAQPVQVEPGDIATLVLAAAYQFHLDKLREPDSRAAVEWALEQVLSQPVHIKLILRQDGATGGGGRGRPGDSNGDSSSPLGHTGQGGRSLQNRSEPAGAGSHGGNHGVLSPGYGPSPSAAVSSAHATAGDNITPMRRHQPAADLITSHPPSTGAPGVTIPDSPLRAQLETLVRADPIIQSLLNVPGMELVELRTLDEDD